MGDLMKRSVFGFFVLMFLIFGLVLLSGNTVVFAKSSEYQSLMQKLETVHKKLNSSLILQEKKVDQDLSSLKQTLEKDYAYMGLHCLGIMTLDYKPDINIKQDSLEKLLDFNQTIYRYHLGLGWDATKIQSSLDQFVAKDLGKATEKIYQHYDTYKKKFLDDIRLYVKNNPSVIMPLVNRMKTMQSLKDEFTQLDNMAEKAQQTLEKKDALLGKIALLKSKLRMLMAQRFDTEAKAKYSHVSDQKIVTVKAWYLADYEKDFSHLYTEVLSVPYFVVDRAEFDAFIAQYYLEEGYNCRNLVGGAWNFDARWRYFNNILAEQKVALDNFSRAVAQYLLLDTEKQDLRKIAMIKKLKLLLDEYMGVKLRAAFLKL